MNLDIEYILKTYLLFPIVAIILSIIVLLVAKKLKMLEDKKGIIYFVVSSVTLSLPGLLGIMEVDFMPVGFLSVQIVYLLVGWLNYSMLKQYVKKLSEVHFSFAFLFLFVQMLMGWALFSVWFNLTNDFQYGIWAGSSIVPILLIPLFLWTYKSYIDIPLEIFKMRVYQATDNFNVGQQTLDADHLLVCEIEVARTTADDKPVRIKAKSVLDMIFGDWFGQIVFDYNQKKVDNQIEINSSQNLYGWIFYTKPSFFRPRKYLDPDLSFADNKFKENQLIIAKRVRQVSE
ncbi:MAG TPA: TssN family type VI secretion system protein [Paludibacteraceae bacterium]|mgnify:CR=1 FL=1|nr:TssN family type VI secretion system protein [Paludibacteraceae bacterium]HPH63062.1 TssN family type VI secretion system protein [Paludibacteraceae bacterium]HQF49993.1 TssN family type VI secretion system protein [Paludibacteraceae bacterium]